jgi:hypothetical protein
MQVKLTVFNFNFENRLLLPSPLLITGHSEQTLEPSPLYILISKPIA